MLPRRTAFIFVMMLLAPAAGAQQLTYRGCTRLPAAQAPGLSGITFAGNGTYWGVLERGGKLVRLRIATRDDGTIKSAAIDRTVALRRGGEDVEGIAFTAQRPDTVMVSTETPAVLEVALGDGSIVGTLNLPPVFQHVVPNQGLEALTYAPDGHTLWTANERALAIDGNPKQPVTPYLSSTRIRLVRYERSGDTLAPAAQFEYQTGGVHGLAGQIGLCDLAALPDGRLLSLERSAAQGLSGAKSIRTRIYLIDPAEAADISGPPYDGGLVEQSPARVNKTLLFDDFVCDADGENLEGLCIGPELSPGRFTVLGVVDHTDGGVGASSPAVIAFELDLTAPATRPATTQPGEKMRIENGG